MKDKLERDAELKDTIISIVKLSSNAEFIRASSNCIFILSYIKSILRNQDFIGINLNDTSIQDLNLEGCNLQFSKFNNVVVDSCNLNLANLKDVFWENLIYNEARPFNKLDYEVAAIAFSYKGETLAIGGKNGIINLWDVYSTKIISELLQHQYQIICMIFSYNDQMLASAEKSGLILWNIQNFQQPFMIGRFCQTNINQLEFNKSNLQLSVFIQGENVIKKLELDVELLKKNFVSTNTINFQNTITAMSFSFDGNYLVTGDTIGIISFYEINYGFNMTNTINYHKSQIKQLVFSQNNQSFASVSEDLFICVWDCSDIKSIINVRVLYNSISYIRKCILDNQFNVFAINQRNNLIYCPQSFNSLFQNINQTVKNISKLFYLENNCYISKINDEFVILDMTDLDKIQVIGCIKKTSSENVSCTSCCKYFALNYKQKLEIWEYKPQQRIIFTFDQEILEVKFSLHYSESSDLYITTLNKAGYLEVWDLIPTLKIKNSTKLNVDCNIYSPPDTIKLIQYYSDYIAICTDFQTIQIFKFYTLKEIFNFKSQGKIFHIEFVQVSDSMNRHCFLYVLNSLTVEILMIDKDFNGEIDISLHCNCEVQLNNGKFLGLAIPKESPQFFAVFETQIQIWCYAKKRLFQTFSLSIGKCVFFQYVWHLQSILLGYDQQFQIIKLNHDANSFSVGNSKYVEDLCLAKNQKFYAVTGDLETIVWDLDQKVIFQKDIGGLQVIFIINDSKLVIQDSQRIQIFELNGAAKPLVYKFSINENKQIVPNHNGFNIIIKNYCFIKIINWDKVSQTFSEIIYKKDTDFIYCFWNATQKKLLLLDNAILKMEFENSLKNEIFQQVKFQTKNKQLIQINCENYIIYGFSKIFLVQYDSKVIHQYRIQEKEQIFKIFFSHRTNQIIYGTQLGNIFILNYEDIFKLKNCEPVLYHKFLIYERLNALGFNEELQIIISAHSCKIFLWDIGTKQKLSTFTIYSQNIVSIVFSPSQKLFASCSKEGRIKLWNLKNSRATDNEIHTKQIQNLKFSHDSVNIISHGLDYCCCLWNVNKKQILKKINNIEKLEYANDSIYIQTTSNQIESFEKQKSSQNLEYLNLFYLNQIDLHIELDWEETRMYSSNEKDRYETKYLDFLISNNWEVIMFHCKAQNDYNFLYSNTEMRKFNDISFFPTELGNFIFPCFRLNELNSNKFFYFENQKHLLNIHDLQDDKKKSASFLYKIYNAIFSEDIIIIIPDENRKLIIQLNEEFQIIQTILLESYQQNILFLSKFEKFLITVDEADILQIRDSYSLTITERIDLKKFQPENIGFKIEISVSKNKPTFAVSYSSKNKIEIFVWDFTKENKAKILDRFELPIPFEQKEGDHNSNSQLLEQIQSNSNNEFLQLIKSEANSFSQRSKPKEEDDDQNQSDQDYCFLQNSSQQFKPYQNAEEKKMNDYPVVKQIEFSQYLDLIGVLFNDYIWFYNFRKKEQGVFRSTYKCLIKFSFHSEQPIVFLSNKFTLQTNFIYDGFNYKDYQIEGEIDVRRCSNNTNYLAFYDSSCKLFKIYDATQNFIVYKKQQPQRIKRIIFSFSDKLLATIDTQNCIEVKSIKDKMNIFDIGLPSEFGKQVLSAEFSIDEQLILIGTMDLLLVIYNMEQNQIIYKLDDFQHPIEQIAFSPNNYQFALGLKDGSIMLYGFENQVLDLWQYDQKPNFENIPICQKIFASSQKLLAAKSIINQDTRIETQNKKSLIEDFILKGAIFEKEQKDQIEY